MKEDSVQPKSRIIIPGHLGPQTKTNRKDASMVVVQIALAIAVSVYMGGETFDASAAFLSGLPRDRIVHVRAPQVGLPA